MRLRKPRLLSSNHKSIMFTTDYFLVFPPAAVATAFTIPGWGFNVVCGVNDNKDVKRQALGLGRAGFRQQAEAIQVSTRYTAFKELESDTQIDSSPCVHSKR